MRSFIKSLFESLIKAYSSCFKRKERTDVHKIRITNSGGFYMRSEDLFDDKDEAIDMIKKVRKAVSKHNEFLTKNTQLQNTDA